MANEQITVPLYAASEILTAANMNISAGTGVPVFATTVTRDAAFGGAGEKVLAEGQLCYLSASNIVQYYDGAAWATVGPTTNKIAQVLSTLKTDSFSVATAVVTDVTGLSVTITPSLATSTILVMASISAGVSNVDGDNVFFAFAGGNTATYKGAAAGSRTRTVHWVRRPGDSVTVAATNMPMTLMYLDSPATTSATTYKVTANTNGTGTGYVNRSGVDTDASSWGRSASTITVMEILA